MLTAHMDGKGLCLHAVGCLLRGLKPSRTRCVGMKQGQALKGNAVAGMRVGGKVRGW